MARGGDVGGEVVSHALVIVVPDVFEVTQRCAHQGFSLFDLDRVAQAFLVVLGVCVGPSRGGSSQISGFPDTGKGRFRRTGVRLGLGLGLGRGLSERLVADRHGDKRGKKDGLMGCVSCHWK